MKLIGDPLSTNKEVLEQAHIKACEMNKVPEDLIEEAKGWNFIRYAVSKIMSDKLKGRPTLIKKTRPVPNREIKIHPSLLRGVYPKKLKKDIHKLNYLKDKLVEGSIPYNTYIDMAKVLNVKDKQINAIPLELGFEV